MITISATVFQEVLGRYTAERGLRPDGFGEVELTQAQFEAVMVQCVKEQGIVSEREHPKAMLIADGTEWQVAFVWKQARPS